MTKYRKLPVEVEAFRWEAQGLIPEWAKGRVKIDTSCYCCLDIETLEGTMTAREGDWIIQGVHGEVYPCKPDIFAKTYEEVV